MIILGGDTVFTCRGTGTIQLIRWLLNGTRLEDLNHIDGMDEVTHGLGHLTFRNISVEFNGTTIQCIVTLTSGEILPSNNVTLLVQGEEKMELRHLCINTLMVVYQRVCTSSCLLTLLNA